MFVFAWCCVRLRAYVCECVIGRTYSSGGLSVAAVQEEVVFKAVLVQTFCHICFQLHFFEKSAVQYANVLFFKKCYCTVNIIVNIFVSS